jgi:hypothetical protein
MRLSRLLLRRCGVLLSSGRVLMGGLMIALAMRPGRGPMRLRGILVMFGGLGVGWLRHLLTPVKFGR